MIGRYAEALELRADDEVGAVLDVSGWSYGDRWGSGTSRAADRMVRRKGRGVRTVLLPQSLGPFEERANARAIARLVEGGALVFARDEWSLDQVQHVTGPADNLRLGVDYFAGPGTHHRPSSRRGDGAFVPNVRVLRGRRRPSGSGTSRCWRRWRRRCAGRGLEPVVLLHTRGQDDAVGDALDQHLGAPLPRIRSEDPRELKGILGRAHAVVGSRFHALVSSLSQGVPTIGIGWAPKYDALFDGFRSAGSSIRASAPDGAVLALLDQILDEPGRSSVIAGLAASSEEQRARVAEMWDAVRRFVEA